MSRGVACALGSASASVVSAGASSRLSGAAQSRGLSRGRPWGTRRTPHASPPPPPGLCLRGLAERSPVPDAARRGVPVSRSRLSLRRAWPRSAPGAGQDPACAAGVRSWSWAQPCGRGAAPPALPRGAPELVLRSGRARWPRSLIPWQGLGGQVPGAAELLGAAGLCALGHSGAASPPSFQPFCSNPLPQPTFRVGAPCASKDPEGLWTGLTGKPRSAVQ